MSMMKAILALAVIAGTVACSTAEVPTGPSVTRGPLQGFNAQSPNGAWVELDGSCAMAGSDANGDDIFGGFGTLTAQLENNNKLVFTCKGSNITNLSGRTQTFRDLPCSIRSQKDGLWYAAESAHGTVTRDGDATLVCIATL